MCDVIQSRFRTKLTRLEGQLSKGCVSWTAGSVRVRVVLAYDPVEGVDQPLLDTPLMAHCSFDSASLAIITHLGSWYSQRISMNPRDTFPFRRHV